jgi:hypothetical protein
MRRICALVTVLALAGVALVTPAVAAADREPTDPLGVVDGFLEARNARDVVGAAGWCATLLSIEDGDAHWVADSASTTEWLRQLSSAYLVDTMTAPHVDGDTVAWSERLTPRGIHFPEALASSVIVDVRVVVQAGRITHYQAVYPPQPSSQGAGAAPESTPSVAPLTLFGVTAAGLALVAGVLGTVGRVALRRAWAGYDAGCG